jgi:hypothetical protein
VLGQHLEASERPGEATGGKKLPLRSTQIRHLDGLTFDGGPQRETHLGRSTRCSDLIR